MAEQSESYEIKKIALDPDTRPLSPDDLFHEDKELLVRLQSSLQAMIDEAATADPRPRHAAPLWRPQAARTPRILMLDGARGTGKTSLMLTLIDRAARCRDTETGRPLSETQLPREDWTSTDTLKRLWFLRPLDLDPIPPGMPLLGWVIRHLGGLSKWLDCKGHGGPRCPQGQLPDLLQGAASRLDHSDQPLSSQWKELHATALKAWASDGGVKITVGELREWVTDQRTRQVAWGRFTDDWERFINRLLVALERAQLLDGSGLLVIPIDDLDMQLARAAEALRMLRLLVHPRLCFLVTGHSEHLRDVLTMDYQGRQRRLSRASFTSKDEAGRQSSSAPSTLALELVRKHIPTSARFETRKLSIRDALAWRNEGLRTALSEHEAFVALERELYGTSLWTREVMTIRQWSQLFTEVRNAAVESNPERAVFNLINGFIEWSEHGETTRKGAFHVRWSDQTPHIVVRARDFRNEGSRSTHIMLQTSPHKLYARDRSTTYSPSTAYLRTDHGSLSDWDRSLLSLGREPADNTTPQYYATQGILADQSSPVPLLHTEWESENGDVDRIGWYGVGGDDALTLLTRANDLIQRLSKSSRYSTHQAMVWVQCNLQWANSAHSYGRGNPEVYATLKQIPDSPNPLPPLREVRDNGSSRAVRNRHFVPGDALSRAADPKVGIQWLSWMSIPTMAHPILGLPDCDAAEILFWSLSDSKEDRYEDSWCAETGHWLDLWETWLRRCGASSRAIDLTRHHQASPWAAVRREANLGTIAWLAEAELRGGDWASWSERCGVKLRSIFALGKAAPTLGTKDATPAGNAVGKLIAKHLSKSRGWRKSAERWWSLQVKLGNCWTAGHEAGAHRALKELWDLCCDLSNQSNRASAVEIASDGTWLTVSEPVWARFDASDLQTGDSSVQAFNVYRGVPVSIDISMELLDLLMAIQGTLAGSDADGLGDLNALAIGQQNLLPPPLGSYHARIAWWNIWAHEAQRLARDPMVSDEGHRRRWLHLFCRLSEASLSGLAGFGGTASWHEWNQRFPSTSEMERCLRQIGNHLAKLENDGLRDAARTWLTDLCSVAEKIFESSYDADALWRAS